VLAPTNIPFFAQARDSIIGECHAHLILSIQCSGRDDRKNNFGVNCELIGEIRQQPRRNLAENSFRDITLSSHPQYINKVIALAGN